VSRRSWCRRSLLVGLLLWPAGLAAQATVDFYLPDTALTVLTNRIGTADLRVYNATGVSAYKITIFVDPTRVQVVGADTLYAYQLAPPTITPSGEQVTLRASGPGTTYSTVILAKLKFQLDSLAQSGSLVSIRVDSLLDGLGADATPGHRTGLLNVCQAEQIGGDVSGDRRVNSRDALAVLTAAVGLPVPGAFDLGRPADVDGDLQATSRDALFILGYGIGLTTYSAPLLGAWLTNKCAPLAPAPNDMVFWRSGSLYKIAATDTIPTALGVSGVDTYYARWSPDGTKLVFTASISAYSYEVMSVNADGTGLDTLTLNGSADFAPDWSPNGSQIAFVSARVSPQSIYRMNADGTSQTRLTTTHTVYDVAWSPDSVRLAFTGYDGSGVRKLWTVKTDGSNLLEVAGSGAHSPQDPVWSPSGDSLIYYSGSRGRVYKVAATGDTVTASSLRYGQDSPWWANTVQTFRSFIAYPYNFFLRRISDGRHLRLTANPGSNDVRAAVRRTLPAPPSVYVDTVSVTPDSILLLADSVNTLTVVVKNNNGSVNTLAPVSWHSRDTTVAKVNNAGIVTASKNAGITYVVATAGWRSDSTKVVVAVTLKSVSAGGYHACGIAADSLAYCWGYNYYGALGTGTTATSLHPMRVAGGLKFVSISAGTYHTCGMTGTGGAYCWGYNGYGQLGDGTLTQRTTPTAVSGVLTFISVDAGQYFTCAVATGNAGYCWGDNSYGQLGDSTTVAKSAPTPVKFGLSFASVSAATYHACGVLTTGEGLCWGYNANGRLGDGSTGTRTYPDTVGGGLNWASISAYNQHSCGVTTTGAGYCWGNDGWGQLGDSTTTFTDRLLPTAVKGGLLFSSVVPGSLHTCGVNTANNGYCWGYNGYGQLGDNSTTYRIGPALVTGGLAWSAMSAGQDFSCGVTTGNVVYCWGYNGYGQLGDGTVTNRLVPARVAGSK